MQYATLNNGVKIPYLGLGVFRITDQGDAYSTVLSALELGYRHIDTAMIYHNEEAVGKAIQDSKIKREDIFLTSKLWIDDIRNNNVRQAFELSLEKLQVEYLDLYLVHWAVKEHYVSVWSEMEAIYQTGKTKAIGVSNYQIHHLEELLSVCSQVPMINQCEIHPYLSQADLLAYCKTHKIQAEAYSPLCANKNELLKDPLLIELSKKYNKTAAQIVLRWNIERGVVVIPKSLNKDRQAENLNIFDFSLSAEDVVRITDLNQNIRVSPDPDNFDF